MAHDKNLTPPATMSSREIAELTGKPHNDVLKAIRVMEPAWVKITGGNFPLSEYKDSTGRKLPMYQLSKTECLYVATKFNDEARARLILRWEELEIGKALPKCVNGIYVFYYLNNPIRFSIGGYVMVNATNMAKPFKKSPIDFLKTQRAKDFINNFSVMKKIITADLVKVIQGGTPQMQGTWMHEDVAIEFARWLSPEFAIWCNDRIKEILQGKQPTLAEYETLIQANRRLSESLEYWKDVAQKSRKAVITECERTNELAKSLTKRTEFWKTLYKKERDTTAQLLEKIS